MVAPDGTVALANQLRLRLGPLPRATQLPLVSILVASHDGVDHLRTLLAGLVERTDYPHLELVVVDNGSTDDSVEFLCSAPAPFPVTVLANRHNESFSDANNQAASAARGELLLFLNNDIEPFEPGWLRELVACATASGADAVGATLIFPDEDRERFPCGYAVQHRGLRFRDDDGTIGPVLHDWEADPLDERLGEDIEVPVVVAACMLIQPALFERVGGFTRGYLYGAEDIDFCLKLHEAGARVLCSGRTLLIHRPGSTRRALEFERARERKLRNHRLLRERWGPRLRREHDLDALAGGAWAQGRAGDGALADTIEQAEALSVCVRASPAPTAPATRAAVEALVASAGARGHRCVLLCDAEIDEARGLECDVAVHVRGPRRYVPVEGQFNVLWAGGLDGGLSAAERERYDLVLPAGAALKGEEVLDAALSEARASGCPARIRDAASPGGLERQIERFIVEELVDDGHAGGDPLAGAMVDSLGVEQLAEFVEEEFGVELADADLVGDNFASVPALAALVRSKLRCAS